jgi:uncharacterized protein YqfA (UPF0365 family)
MPPALTIALLVLFAAILVFLCALTILVFVLAFAPWLRAYLSGVPIPLLEILSMRVRRADVDAVVRAVILARQAGIPVSCREVESAYSQGVDVEKVLRVLLEAPPDDPQAAFQDLISAALGHRSM